MVYILEIKTTQAAAIKIVTDAVNSLLTDANFEFRPYYIEDEDEMVDENGEVTINQKKIGGVVVKEINKTGTILVYMRLDADKFDVYKYNYHKPKLTLGIDIGNLLKCLKCMSQFDTMTWLVDDEDINKLIIVLESAERKEKKTFKLNLIDLEEYKCNIDPIQFPYLISLPSQDFHKYCKDMTGATEKIEIKATYNKLFFSGSGESGHVEFEVGETNGGLSIISNTNNTHEIVQGVFELKFLLIFTKCTNLCNQVTLFLKNDYPIIVTYQIAALGEIKLVLSPTNI
jgi:proliferating cell nuclear antigen